MSAKSDHFHKARKAKNDEFYTRYSDIVNELSAYRSYTPDIFRGKSVYCNCDNPYYSQFFRYFVDNFNELGLRQLTVTNYCDQPYDPLRPENVPHKVTIRSIPDYLDTVDNDWMDTLDQLKIQDDNEWDILSDSGDFGSAECIDILNQSDIVVTNPPFSLFQKYMQLLLKADKEFVVIGNKNALVSKILFPYIQENKIWVGATSFNTDMVFNAPSNTDFNAIPKSASKLIDGVYYLRAPAVWVTNIDHARRHSPLPLRTMDENRLHNTYIIKNPNSYKKYDNYAAIEVPRTSGIPSDYDGVVGVPLSFLDVYCPEQFDIIGSSTYAGQCNTVYGEKSLIDGKVTFSRVFIQRKTL